MNFNKFTYLKRLKCIIILFLLIVFFNNIILPASGLTVTGISIKAGLKITPTLTGFALSPASVTFGASAPVITPPTSASSGELTYTSSNTAVATVSGTTITLVGVGTTTMTATQAAADNYTSATSTATLTVTIATNVATQIISSLAPTLTGFALTPASVAFGASPPVITPPTSASSGALTYTSSNTAVATVSGTTITLVGVGTATMTATQAAAGNYTSATSTATLTVTGVTPILTGFALNPAIVAFGASSPIITPPTSASSGALSYSTSNPAVATVSGTTITLIGAGNTIMTATQVAAGNYTSATSTATLTVTSTTATCFNSGQVVSSVVPPYYSCNCTSGFTGDQCQNINLGGSGF